jgi:RNA polymerase sigma factor (TIGR02999 family)
VSTEDKSITLLLQRWSAGDREAAARVLPLVYDELRRIASEQFGRERNGHTLQATAVVNEAYLRLSGQRGLSWPSRAHFFAFAAHLMRRVLVDYARHHNRDKRGGHWERVTLAEAGAVLPRLGTDLEALDQALDRLGALDAQKAAVVEMRFFGGLTLEETAQQLGVSPETVSRQWRRAKAWLSTQLQPREVPFGRSQPVA